VENKNIHGTLHVFQKTMLLWDEMHPYNAVHVVRIPQPLDLPRIRSIIQQQLELYHLTGFALDRTQKRFSYLGGTADIDIKIVEQKKETSTALDNEIELQINTSFPTEGLITPFRFFVVKEDHFFYLGLVYLHFISDAESIVYILKSIVNTYMNKRTADVQIPLRHYPCTLRHMMQFNLKYLMSWLLTLPSYIADVRRSCRVSYTDIDNYHMSFSHVTIEPSQFLALVKASKRWGVTINDILIAILLLSVSPFASKRLSSTRRKKISVASVVNIRKDLPIGIQRPFGLYLGSFMVSHTVPQGVTLDHLVKDIHKQTVKIKRHKLYLRSLIEQLLALTLIPHFSTKRQRKFYAKYYPLWGGISNVNLNTLWDQSIEENPIDYLRAVSTNPVVPLVFSLTTVQDTVNIGVSFRGAVFSRADGERIIREISKCLKTIGMTL
jgi:NRPS condensation-like uncharacterized protein